MPAAWTTFAGLAAPSCVVCCTPIEACRLTMPNTKMDGTTTPYADATAAAAALTDKVVDCLVQLGSSIDDETAAIVGGDLVVTKPTPAWSFGSIQLRFSAPLLLSAGLVTVSYDVVFAGDESALDAECNAVPFYGDVVAQIFDTDWNLIDTGVIGLTATSATGTFSLSVPSDGCYFVFFDGTTLGTWNSCEGEYTASPGMYVEGSVTIANAGLTPGEIAADWDDGVDTGTVVCT